MTSSSNSSDYNCDDQLKLGWYRFTSCAGDTIPLVAPASTDVCGAQYGVWMNGRFIYLHLKAQKL